METLTISLGSAPRTYCEFLNLIWNRPGAIIGSRDLLTVISFGQVMPISSQNLKKYKFYPKIFMSKIKERSSYVEMQSQIKPQLSIFEGQSRINIKNAEYFFQIAQKLSWEYIHLVGKQRQTRYPPLNWKIIWHIWYVTYKIWDPYWLTTHLLSSFGI